MVYVCNTNGSKIQWLRWQKLQLQCCVFCYQVIIHSDLETFFRLDDHVKMQEGCIFVSSAEQCHDVSRWRSSTASEPGNLVCSLLTWNICQDGRRCWHPWHFLSSSLWSDTPWPPIVACASVIFLTPDSSWCLRASLLLFTLVTETVTATHWGSCTVHNLLWHQDSDEGFLPVTSPTSLLHSLDISRSLPCTGF